MFQSTPLHISSSKGKINVVKHLVECRADINAKDRHKVELFKKPKFRSLLQFKGLISIICIISIDKKLKLHNRGILRKCLESSYKFANTVSLFDNNGVRHSFFFSEQHCGLRKRKVSRTLQII